ncbi:MAG: heavy metal translocating P-type ATPase, partial [Betaproteobacteria bacterium]|nr:heavy metal translocating P-type ATPase [Betaproteobacteria bacterium]
MSTTLLPTIAAAPSQSWETCFHCGLPVPEKTTLRISFNGQWKAVCCVGCEAVANTILQNGLGHYYSERSVQPGQAVLPPPLRDHSAYDLPAVSQTYLTETQDGQAAVKLYIEGITCAACVWLAETTLQRTPGVNQASVNQTTHQADIRFNSQQTSLSALIDTLTRIGLGAAPASAALRQTERLKQRRQQLQALGIALLSMMQVMMFTVPLYFTDPGDVTDEAKHLMDWAS